MTIWKYVLEVADEQFVEMPQDAKLLDVQVQNGVPCLWALVDPRGSRERRGIYMRGTGHDATSIHLGGASYLATFQFGDLGLVFHVFA